jgi:hypothetical protein
METFLLYLYWCPVCSRVRVVRYDWDAHTAFCLGGHGMPEVTIDALEFATVWHSQQWGKPEHANAENGSWQ